MKPNGYTRVFSQLQQSFYRRDPSALLLLPSGVTHNTTGSKKMVKQDLKPLVT